MCLGNSCFEKSHKNTIHTLPLSLPTLYQFQSLSLSPRSKTPILFVLYLHLTTMDQQEQASLDFFDEFTRKEQAQESSTTAQSSSSRTVFSAEDHPEIVVDNTHITLRDSSVTCNLPQISSSVCESIG